MMKMDVQVIKSVQGGPLNSNIKGNIDDMHNYGIIEKYLTILVAIAL